MPGKNTLILLVITVLTLSLSAFLFYQGLKAEFGKNLTTQNPSPSSDLVQASPSSNNVLGQEASSPGEVKSQPETSFLVTKVVDGDTIEIDYLGNKTKLRLIGIDTPETVDPRRPVGCFGKEASNETKRILEGQRVTLEKDVSEVDKFGRLLRYVYLKLSYGSTLFVNDYLVRQGFAHAATFPPDVKYADRFRQAEQDARENLRGLWASCPSK